MNLEWQKTFLNISSLKLTSNVQLNLIAKIKIVKGWFFYKLIFKKIECKILKDKNYKKLSSIEKSFYLLSQKTYKKEWDVVKISTKIYNS